MNWQPIKAQWRWLVGITLVLVILEMINLLTGRALNSFGLIPRQMHSLPMMFSSPFLHGSPQHLFANLTVLWLFVALMGFQGQRRFVWITLWLILFTGTMVWLFGRFAVHVGASGLIYGYFGFLVLAGWRSKRKRMLLISLAIALVYGTMIFGALPQAGFVSWESHFFGFIGGLIAAWYWAK
ncbi:rhomboid family intramembrane serine protease [Alteromonas oceanisediminis]|uniref:rhomboid family intramembrane serine protease n=1 Tax=Alteromonas oceanisediminis TaxID=2836180 RepID=UPI001BD9F9BA|nr:rhomboid family intramembrane serine protease [Alteromonas oceanisediminis]MBT0585707.1 rhomboid family intramembrane serine protease [Alteromonas oceanisediminis]